MAAYAARRKKLRLAVGPDAMRKNIRKTSAAPKTSGFLIFKLTIKDISHV